MGVSHPQERSITVSPTASLIALVGMAVATVAILTISTLAAADLLPRRTARPSATRRRSARH
jgi:hypothetical protein